MYPFIICFCGRSLGDIYDVFKLMRAAKYEEVYAELSDVVDPAVIPITESTQVDLVDIFALLHITMQCCKMHLATQVEFKELY